MLCGMTEKPGTARALAAAQAVAVANCVAREEAVVVAAGSNVLVHLKPASSPTFFVPTAGLDLEELSASRQKKAREAGLFSTPRVGLEPTTLRLTAGCSAN
jgi:hypothetical protein